MTEMLDRVTNAMRAQLAKAGSGDVTSDMARAAIEAMRDPTDEMTEAFYASCDEHGHVLWHHGYQAMIDAALATAKPGGE